MNPMDDPEQRAGYIAQRKKEAQQMADQERRDRDAERAAIKPRDRCSPATVGLSGPPDGMQTVDS